MGNPLLCTCAAKASRAPWHHDATCCRGANRSLEAAGTCRRVRASCLVEAEAVARLCASKPTTPLPSSREIGLPSGVY